MYSLTSIFNFCTRMVVQRVLHVEMYYKHM